MSDKKYISPEHAIRNIMNKKVAKEIPSEEKLDEAYVGGQKSLKPTAKQKQDMETNIKNLPGSIDAFGRGAASSVSFGTADHIAAGLDYGVKNYIGKPLGLSKGTDYETELKQEQEKTAKAKKDHADAYTVGEWTPLAAGGAKIAASAAAAAPATIKAIPGAIKSFAKWYGKTSPIDVIKGVIKSAGGDIVKNPIKYAKELPSVAKGMAKLGAGTEIADKSVGLPEFGFGGQGWKQGAI